MSNYNNEKEFEDQIDLVDSGVEVIEDLATAFLRSAVTNSYEVFYPNEVPEPETNITESQLLQE